MKQSRLRKRRVWRFAILYFVLLIVALALIVGPIVAGKQVLTDSLIKSIPMDLYQPNDLNNNDTRGRNATGTGAKSSDGSDAAQTSGAGAKVRLF
jgi:1,3-beta-glucan synthase